MLLGGAKPGADRREPSAEVLTKPFNGGHANQMLNTLGDEGMTFKNRRGRYAFALALLADFIQRQSQ